MSSPSPKSDSEATKTPYRQIRALYDENTITVYQAYSQEIAEAAVREQRLDASPAFSYERMTWIKPSWCWMMYRSGYASKDPRQTHILALTLTHACFLSLLSQAAVCNHGPLSADERNKPVRVQWDPERSPAIGALPYRSLQVGIGRKVAREWVEGGGIVKIEDVSVRARELGEWAVEESGKGKGKRDLDQLVGMGLVPRERVFDVPEEIRVLLGMD
ncbi:hypothetical protein DL98DRAFT_560366 [Cadophora sp. DSE1049]|nr:hypothetical protein DL98DRAFT_560366 [Cadophora sp. DSE1049]